MARLLAALLLLVLLAPAQETMPSGVTCCDEGKIRAAMAEEALRRVAAIAAGAPAGETDYLSAQAYERIRRRLPAGNGEPLLELLRRELQAAAADEDTREFQKLVGHFVLGMTLEIGQTFQDEYDLLQTAREKLDRLLSNLETPAGLADDGLGRALFHAGLGDKELRGLRALERRWKDPAAEAAPFDEFSALKRNVCGRAADTDQRLAFTLAERYRAAYPFLDEFLANYRRLAGEYRAAARHLNEILAIKENYK